MLSLQAVACQLQVSEYRNCAAHGGVQAPPANERRTQLNRYAMRCRQTGGSVSNRPRCSSACLRPSPRTQGSRREHKRPHETNTSLLVLASCPMRSPRLACAPLLSLARSVSSRPSSAEGSRGNFMMGGVQQVSRLPKQGPNDPRTPSEASRYQTGFPLKLL